MLFFVISGFLITRILLGARTAAAEQGVPRRAVLRAFYARRFLRIFPLYYAVLFLAFVIGAASIRAALPWHLSYLSNWYFCYGGKLDLSHAGHLWSLAVEEQFYILWPWFALLLRTAALPWAIGAMILTGPLYRFAIAAGGFNDGLIWMSTPAVFDALGIGCLLAYLWQNSASAGRIARGALIAGILLVALQQANSLLAMPKPVFSVIYSVSSIPWAGN